MILLNLNFVYTKNVNGKQKFKNHMTIFTIEPYLEKLIQHKVISQNGMIKTRLYNFLNPSFSIVLNNVLNKIYSYYPIH